MRLQIGSKNKSWSPGKVPARCIAAGHLIGFQRLRQIPLNGLYAFLRGCTSAIGSALLAEYRSYDTSIVLATTQQTSWHTTYILLHIN